MKGRGGETALQIQKAMWTAYMRKNQAKVSALSRIAALYSRMYLPGAGGGEACSKTG